MNRTFDNPSTEITKLLSEFSALSTFDEVSAWDQEAANVIEAIAKIVRQIEENIQRLSFEERTPSAEVKERSLLSRMFSGSEEKKTKQEILDLPANGLEGERGDWFLGSPIQCFVFNSRT